MSLAADRRIVFVLASFGLLALGMGILAAQPGRAAGPGDVAPQQPEITVAPLVLSDTLGPGGESTRTLTISNGGGLDLSWVLVENPQVVWLAEEPVSGTVTPDGVAAVEVTFDAEDLSEGVYTTTLEVSSNDPDEPQIDVSVLLTVAPCIPVAGADFSYEPPDPQGGESVEFRGVVSQGSGVLVFRWALGDGESATGQLVHHRFPLSVMTQTYTVVLTVSGCVNQEMVSRDVTVRPSGDIIYVDGDATGVPDGHSWETAYPELQPALTQASPGDEIWVAEGTYKPSVKYGGSRDRFKSFQLKNGVALYGGFAGTETSRDERNWMLHETILSGDVGTEGNDTDNSYHVFYHPLGTALDNTAILDGFTITGGNADGDYPHERGGGMYNDASSPTLTNCTFAGNSAGGRYGYGGGMYNHASSPTLTNCTFAGNSARDYGGGMYNRYDSSPVLTNCTFVGNSATSGGGMLNRSSSPALTNCLFEGNLAHRLGGGMCNGENSSPTLTNCTFEGNSADIAGGGMCNGESSSPTLTNCTFEGNSADYDGGGGMYNSSSSLTLTDCSFSGNLASDYGGGMYNHSSSPALSNCTFEGNLASYGGGGMYNSSSSPTLTDCLFSSNSADDSGGGMYNENNSSPALGNCTFASNSAGYGGGGMLNYTDSSPALSNCTFAGNSAEIAGGGMCNDASSPTLTNCSFSGNSAGSTGGGMYNWDSSLALTNCILWGDAPEEIFNEDPASSPVVTYSDIEGGYPGEGNIDADPRFADPDNGDLHLKPGSPCIDAGTNDAPNLPEHDFEGDDRIVDGNGDGTATVDMGVDEAVFLYPSHKTASTSAALPGDPVTYTLALHNEAPIDSTEIQVTDTLPLSLTYVEDSLTATAGSYGYASRVITWTGSLSAGGSVRITFGTTISTIVPLGTEVINSAVISGAGEIVTRTATVFVGHQIYLPVVMRAGS